MRDQGTGPHIWTALQASILFPRLFEWMAAHARLAVQAALAMRQAVHELNAQHLAQGLPAIGMGIGLNTGTMCVGDMGSALRRSYTVIGDAVNLGSRLEGLGKFYGVDVVVSQATVEQAGNGFVWQELDLVRVKGKEEAVRIYTLVGANNEVTTAAREELQTWGEALRAFRQQDWDHAAQRLATLASQRPGFELYPLFLTRMQAFRLQPPEAYWDGSYRFDTK